MCHSLMPHAILSKVVPKKLFTSQSWKITVTEPGLCHKIGWGGEGGLHVLLPSPNTPFQCLSGLPRQATAGTPFPTHIQHLSHSAFHSPESRK